MAQNEHNEEFDKIAKMSSYERLVHLRKMAIFCKQMGEENSMISEVLIITKDYKDA